VVGNAQRHDLSNYVDPKTAVPVFRIRAKPLFSPIDLNVTFLGHIGWSQSADRLRFHTKPPQAPALSSPMGEIIHSLQPHLLIRRLDREEDRSASMHIALSGEITLLSSDCHFAHQFFEGPFLEYPPSFHTWEEFDIEAGWVDDAELKAMFAGLIRDPQLTSAGAPSCSTQ